MNAIVWTAYPIFVATIISVIGLSRIAIKTKATNTPNQTLSELAAAEEKVLTHFRSVLALCGVLFAVTVFGFLAPRAHNPALIIIFGILMIAGELLAALIPARGVHLKVHLALAFCMAVGMLGLTASFWLTQTGALSLSQAAFTAVLCVFATLTALDKRRYVVYELGYIFTSHLSLIFAVVLLK